MSVGEGKAQLSTKLTLEEVDRLREALERESAELLAPGRYELFRARLDDSLVVVYRTGRAVYHSTLIKLIESVLIPPPGIEVGSDEAGKGEISGPIVVAAVALDPNSAVRLRALGLVESKSISRREIPRVARLVREFALSSAVRVVTPEEFKVLWSRGNLNALLAQWHLEVLQAVLDEVENVHTVVVDSFDSGELEASLKSIIPRRTRLVVEPKADERYVSVAAASVLARVERDKALKEGFNQRKWLS